MIDLRVVGPSIMAVPTKARLKTVGYGFGFTKMLTSRAVAALTLDVGQVGQFRVISYHSIPIPRLKRIGNGPHPGS